VTRKLARPRSADAALARLVAGNARFVGGTARFPTVQKEVLASLAKGQSPYATELDVTAAEMLSRLATELDSKGTALKFARANRPRREPLAAIGPR
jgi:hypothetical protein